MSRKFTDSFEFSARCMAANGLGAIPLQHIGFDGGSRMHSARDAAGIATVGLAGNSSLASIDAAFLAAARDGGATTAPRAGRRAAPRMSRIAALLAASLSLFAPATGANARPAAGVPLIGAGAGQQTVTIGGVGMKMFTYRPRNCAKPDLLLVFHGLSRTADSYRDYARLLADQLCMVVVAPLFDEQRFPGWRYQAGGIVDHGVVQASNTWTGNLVLGIVDWVRRAEGRNVDYYMLGHSAGGQFLSRVAAFVPTEAKRIVVANPSTYVFPSLTAAPFGLGGVYSGPDSVAELRRYLALPLTIFLGREDTGDKERNDSPQAVAQGGTRYERGLNAYRAGRDLARAQGWAFNWRLVVLPGVGHEARKMFTAPQTIAALRP